MVDAFNVLDGDKARSVNRRWGDYRYQWDAHPEESEWRANDYYQEVTSIQTPRTVRLGAKFTF